MKTLSIDFDVRNQASQLIARVSYLTHRHFCPHSIYFYQVSKDYTNAVLELATDARRYVVMFDEFDEVSQAIDSGQLATMLWECVEL